MKRRTTILAVLGLSAPWIASLLAGCDSGAVHQIARIRDNGRPHQLDVPIAIRFGGGAAGSGLGAQAVADLLVWKAPAGWETQPPKPLRAVNLKKGDVQCFVSFLTGGGAARNINRWRAQMGATPVSPMEMDALKTARILAREAWVLDLEGTYQGMDGIPQAAHRMVAAYVAFPAFALSVKMYGPKDQVQAERKNFDAFCQSLDFDVNRGLGQRPRPDGMPGAADEKAGASDPHANPTAGRDPRAVMPAMPVGGFDPHELRWNLPGNWTPKQGSGMRFVTFEVGRGTEAYILFLPLDGGGLIANINRWRQQMQQAPLAKKEIDALPRVRIMGMESPVLEAYSPKGEGLMATQTRVPGQTLFVKMVGPADRVRAAKDAFFAFCASLRSE